MATGRAAAIEFYIGKNDFWSTRDVPSGGCAYALMGAGSFSIRSAAPPAGVTRADELGDTVSADEVPAPPKQLNCTDFNCTCQGFANYFGAIAGKGWGCPPQPAGKQVRKTKGPTPAFYSCIRYSVSP